MKAWHVVLISLFLTCGICGGVGYYALRGTVASVQNLDREGKASASAALPAVLKSWSWDALAKRSDPALIGDGLGPKAAFGAYAEQFGSLKSLGEPTMVGFHSYSGTDGRRDVVELSYPAEFERSAGATVRVRLVRDEAKVWKFLQLDFGKP